MIKLIRLNIKKNKNTLYLTYRYLLKSGSFTSNKINREKNQ